MLQRVVEVYAERLQQQNIVVKTVLMASIPLILADAEHLQRAIANIVLNAIEAMPTGGELTIACRPVPKPLVDFAASGLGQEQDAAQDMPAVADDLYASSVEVVISDTGAGIPPEQLEVLFTPFLSTKAKGNGLGLALTHKILEEHHGSIQITSQVGQGTAVTMILPVAPAGSLSPAQNS